MSAKNEYGLTPKQEKFAHEVASGKSQSDAYRAAYAAGKMTAKQIHEEASKLAANPMVSQRVRDLIKKVEREFVIDKARVLREIARIAFSDTRKLTKAGRAQLPEDLDDDTSAAVSGFKLDEYGRLEYKFWDKNAALEKLAKHLGLFKEDNEQQAPAVFQKIELVGVRPKTEPGKA